MGRAAVQCAGGHGGRSLDRQVETHPVREVRRVWEGFLEVTPKEMNTRSIWSGEDDKYIYKKKKPS